VSVSTLEYGLKLVKITDTSYENPQAFLPISRAKLAKYLWQRQNTLVFRAKDVAKNETHVLGSIKFSL
jgi:hypothetical protein